MHQDESDLFVFFLYLWWIFLYWSRLNGLATFCFLTACLARVFWWRLVLLVDCAWSLGEVLKPSMLQINAHLCWVDSLGFLLLICSSQVYNTIGDTFADWIILESQSYLAHSCVHVLLGVSVQQVVDFLAHGRVRELPRLERRFCLIWRLSIIQAAGLCLIFYLSTILSYECVWSDDSALRQLTLCLCWGITVNIAAVGQVFNLANGCALSLFCQDSLNGGAIGDSSIQKLRSLPTKVLHMVD